jgi:hypothetical protein
VLAHPAPSSQILGRCRGYRIPDSSTLSNP